MKYQLWVGSSIVMESNSIESLKAEIDWEFEGYLCVITDNNNKEIFRQEGE